MVEKNGQDILKAIGTAVAVVVISVIAALVIGSILSSSVFSQGEVNGTVTNETLINVTNITTSSFAILDTNPNAVCILDSVYNSTSGELLNANNYTRDSCTIIMNSSSAYIGEDLNVTYDFTYQAAGSTIINVNDVKTLFGEFITGLLGFLGIIGIVLGVVWLIVYVAKLFNKGGLNDLGATA